MDIRFIRDLAGVMQEYNLNRLDYSCGDTKLELEIYGENTSKKNRNILDNQNTIVDRLDIGSDKENNKNYVTNNIERQNINQETSDKNDLEEDLSIGTIQSNMIGT